MTDLSINKIRDMLAVHNDGVYLLGQRENIGEIVEFLLNDPEYYYTDDMAGDWDYLADMEDLMPGEILELSAARTVGKAYVACIENQHRLFKTKDEARAAIDSQAMNELRSNELDSLKASGV